MEHTIALVVLLSVMALLQIGKLHVNKQFSISKARGYRYQAGGGGASGGASDQADLHTAYGEVGGAG